MTMIMPFRDCFPVFRKRWPTITTGQAQLSTSSKESTITLRRANIRHLFTSIPKIFSGAKQKIGPRNTVFNSHELVALIMENVTDIADLLNFVYINQTTKHVFERYHKAILTACLRTLRPRLADLALSIVLLEDFRAEIRSENADALNRLSMQRLPDPVGIWLQPLQPIQMLRLLTNIRNRIDSTGKALRWPRGKYMPYEYKFRTRPGSLSVHSWTAEGRDIQQRIERNTERALWQLHLYNEMFYAHRPGVADRISEDLSEQLTFMDHLHDRDVIELYRLFKALYSKIRRLKEPAYAALFEKLRIGDAAFASPHDGPSPAPPFWHVKRHLVYQLSIALPHLLKVRYHPRDAAVRAESSDDDVYDDEEGAFTKKKLMHEAIWSHLLRAKQRRSLWGRPMYRLKAVFCGNLSHVRYVFFPD